SALGAVPEPFASFRAFFHPSGHSRRSTREAPARAAVRPGGASRRKRRLGEGKRRYRALRGNPLRPVPAQLAFVTLPVAEAREHPKKSARTDTRLASLCRS